jgi:hypothetical protein
MYAPVHEMTFVFEHALANKKSHFRPSEEMSMKNVDKDAVNTK